jgi:hypothetical protein
MSGRGDAAGGSFGVGQLGKHLSQSVADLAVADLAVAVRVPIERGPTGCTGEVRSRSRSLRPLLLRPSERSVD